MTIRPYQEKDEKQVIDLWFKCDLVVPWNNPKYDIERKLKVQRDLFLLGIVDGKIIASVMGGYEGHRAWVNYLAVDPDYQGKGYGRKMMETLEQAVVEKGSPKIQLQVRRTNQKVIDFYKYLGYKEDDVIGLGKRLEEDEPYM